MSDSGKRKVYLVTALIMFSVLQIWILSGDHCSIRATFTSPPSQPPPPPQDSDAVKKAKLHRKYFSGRFPHKSFQENKRIVPSCPDPLHN
ncbi:hypothetical protein CTI12_AA022030 [Artemisia annua]|uniref:Uncharacterized protein n=1 Tax=Artemisia annua TaxID=35608 RepID=A0A2U1QJK5_ARTAN|nr:hypothetical protein CTI12_AA022030 [Artemisia annua]